MTTAELVDRYAAAVVALRIAENRLLKVPALVEELREQWRSNHAEHCRWDWPHEGDCHWPKPEALVEWERDA